MMYAQDRIGRKPVRIHSLDLARGLAVLFMILVHVLENYGRETVYNTAAGQIVEFLGGPPAAPVFMFLMGFFLIYPADKGIKTNAFRGMKVMALGYLLSFLRYTLPESLGITDYGGGFDFFSFIWEVDILQFAGFAMILLAVIRHFVPWPRTWILLAVLVTVSSPLLWGINSGIPALDWLLGLLWGSCEEVWFPVFPWLSFPLLGMAFRFYTLDADGNYVLGRRTVLLGLIALASGTAITAMSPDYHIGDYYRSGPGLMIWMSGFVLIWLFLCEQAIRRLPETGLFRLFCFWSRNVTLIYFIQWIIIGWGVAIFPYMGVSITTTIAIMAATVPMTHWAARGWLALKSGCSRCRK